MNPTRQDRRIDYVEMPSNDLPATRAFYERVFGWSFTDYGPTYSAFNDGRMDGGFDADDRPSSSAGPLVILYAHDLEAVLADVTAAGAEILRPTYSFPGGRRFHFRDPGGNELAVWSDR